MKRTLIITLACALGLALSGVTAQASPLPLTYGGDYYLGNFMPNNGNPTFEADRINVLNDYNDEASGSAGGFVYSRVGSTLGNPPFPNAVLPEFKLEDVSSINATGYQYVLAKYGGGQVAGYSLVWFNIAGFSGDVAPQANYDDNGLSHITLFNRVSVPDGGMTLMLLGGALVGIGALRRRFRA